MINNSNKKYKILVAEDDEFLLKALVDKLEREGFDVFTAYDGEDALVKAKECSPDLMLLDLVLPVKDGFEVLKEMKASEDFKKIPVIILSNLSQEADIKKGLELGAIDYLIKSGFTINIVVEKVKEQIEKYLKQIK